MVADIGVNCHPDDQPIDLLGVRVKSLCEGLPRKDLLQIKYDCDAVVTVDNCWLVLRVINMKDAYKRFLGVHASMTDLALPGRNEGFSPQGHHCQ